MWSDGRSLDVLRDVCTLQTSRRDDVYRGPGVKRYYGVEGKDGGLQVWGEVRCRQVCCLDDFYLYFEEGLDLFVVVRRR